MELKEFIKTAITDITEAISELQGEIANGAIVSPSMPYSISTRTVKHDGCNRLISNVDFDIATTVGAMENIIGNAKAGIQIFSAKVGGESKAETEHVSRLVFSVPVIFPTSKMVADNERVFNDAQEKTQNSLHALRSSGGHE